jgi:Holliday junction resolvase RusA-like endonuclease
MVARRKLSTASVLTLATSAAKVKKPKAPPPTPTVADGTVWGYWISGTPRSAKNSMRPLKLGNGRTILAKSKVAKGWADHATSQLVQQQRPPVPLCGAIHVHVDIRQSSRRPDGDNVQSAVWDVLTAACIIADDSYISHWSGRKWTGMSTDDHGIAITVEQVGP